MTQAATLSIALALPQAAGAFPQAPWPPAPGISVQYEQAVTYPRIVFSSAASLTLSDFALLPAAGAQVLLVTLDPVDDTNTALTAPVRFNLSGSTSGTIWLPVAGGQFALVAPGTAAGVTGLQVVTTAPAIVRVQAAG